MLLEELAAGAATGLTGGLFGYASNERNIAMQRETNQQNERLMREAWGREDSSVQRRTADLKAAGLSPVLAAGQGASSMSPIKMDAPQGQDWGSQAASQAISGTLAATQLRQTEAQMALTRAQERQVDINTNISLLKTPAELNAINAASSAARANAYHSTQQGRVTKVDATKAETAGITPSSSAFGKMANDALAGIDRVQKYGQTTLDTIKKKGYIEAYKDAYRK